MSFFTALLSSLLTLLYALAGDLLGLSTRPLILINSMLQSDLLAPFAKGELLLGLLGTTTLVLVGISLCTLGSPKTLEPLGKAAAVVLAVDGLTQVPCLVVPHALWYSPSHTGLLVLPQLLAGWVAVGGKLQFDSVAVSRGGPLALACSLRFAAANQQVSPVVAHGMLALSALLAVFAVTPHGLRDMLGRGLTRLLELLRSAFCCVYSCVTDVWPWLCALFWSCLDHPCISRLQALLVGPAWRVVSPLMLPLATAGIAAASAVTVLDTARQGVRDWNSGIVCLGQLLCGAAGALSTVILLLHAVSRLRGLAGLSLLDPLRHRRWTWLLRCCARALALPWYAIWHTLRGRVVRALQIACVRCCEFASNSPLLAIPAVLTTNGALFYFFFASANGANLLGLLAVFARRQLGGAFDSLMLLQGGSLDEIADSTLTLGLCALAQIGTYAVGESILFSVQAVRRRGGSGGGGGGGNVVGTDELNALAGAMGDPRQCGRCAFGPVDHAGCSNLATHHGEVHMGRPAVSNACPRCVWFVSTISLWPAWDGLLRTAAGQAVFRQRVWGELVVCVRAASKALAFPLVLMRLGAALQLDPSVAAFLGLSYLLPWGVENARIFSATYRADVFLRNRRHPHARGRARGAAGAQGAAAVPYGDNLECGAAPAAPALPTTTTSEALNNLLAAYPERVFLHEEDLCAVCMDEFGAAAVASALSLKGQAVSLALRGLEPPIVALRCGHPLHLACAEAAVRAVANRHVRCPLCREPVSLGGAVSARMFS